MTPADEIRTAAAKLRNLATTASTADDGTPTAAWNFVRDQHDTTHPVTGEPIVRDNSRLYGGHITNGRGERHPWPNLIRGRSNGRGGPGPYMRTRHAAYAATMGPSVGLALAGWLDDEASKYDASVRAADDVFRDDPDRHVAFPATGLGAPNPHALTIARLINQQQP